MLPDVGRVIVDIRLTAKTLDMKKAMESAEKRAIRLGH